MDATPPADGAASGRGRRYVDVKVLSQIQDQGIILLHRLLADTTVQQLKDHIRGAVRSHPSITNQRLIYRGRVLMNDAATLESIFAPETGQQSDPQIVHLVIREPHNATPATQTPHAIASQTAGDVSRATVQPLGSAASGAAPNAPPPQQLPAPAAFGRGLAPVDQFTGFNSALPSMVPSYGQSFGQSFAAQQRQVAQNVHAASGPALLGQTPFGFNAGNIEGQPFVGPPMFANQVALQQHLLQAQQALNTIPLQGQRNNQSLNEILQSAQRVQQQVEGIQRQLQDVGNQSHSNQRPRSSDDGPRPTHAAGENSDAATTTSTQQPSQEQQTTQASSGDINPNNDPAPVNGIYSSTQMPQSYNYSGRVVSADGTTHIAGGRGPIPAGMFVNPHLNGAQQVAQGTVVGVPMDPAHIVDMGIHHLAQIPRREHWLGPHHAIQDLERLQERLDSAISSHWQLRDSRPHGLGSAEIIARARATRQSRDEIGIITQQRNERQQVVNHVLASGVPRGHTPPSPQDVVILQAMHDRFATSVRAFREGDERRRQTASTGENNSIPTSSVPTQSTEPAAGSPEQVLTAAIDPAPDPAQTFGPLTDQPGRGRPAAEAMTDRTAFPSAHSVAAYLLNGPNGPQAIVYAPQGVFHSRSAAPVQSSVTLGRRAYLGQGLSTVQMFQQHNLGDNAAVHRSQRQPQLLPQTQHQHHPRDSGAIQRRVRERLAQVAGNNNAPAAPVAPGVAVDNGNPNGRNYAINLTPLFRAVWLFVRIYGIMWLFLGGTGTSWASWRMLALIAGSVIYWAVQAGVGEEWVQWAQVHWNHLIGMDDLPGPNAEPPEPPGRGFLWGEDPEAIPHPPRRHDQHGPTTIRQFLRPIERTIMLFIASLYPGVGERTVAAREREQREEAEREIERSRAAAAATEAAANRQANEAEQTAQAAQAQDSSESLNDGQPDKAISGTAATTEGSSSAVAVRDGQNGLTERRSGLGADW